jgi:hypothetical protein
MQMMSARNPPRDARPNRPHSNRTADPGWHRAVQWLESLPLLPQVDGWITTSNEEDELAIRRSGLSAKDGEVAFDRFVQLIERR